MESKMPRTPSATIPDEDKPVAPYRAPDRTAARERDINRAAEAYALAHNSDPFTHGRAVLHMRRGLVFPSEILSDANALLAARQAAKVAAFED
jgi:hypothetical protein